jgi:SOS-response transcriptional repressor LexA
MRKGLGSMVKFEYEDLPFFEEFRIPPHTLGPVSYSKTMCVGRLPGQPGTPTGYVIRVATDTMEPRIQDGDCVLVDYGAQPHPGNVILGTINGAPVLRQYLNRKERVLLRSTNAKYGDIVIKDSDRFSISGVVLKIVDGEL